MKLRNKKTGEINLGDLHLDDFNSLAELNEEWEDYEEAKEHYEILAMGAVMEREDTEDEIFRNQGQREIGNYFETREEAEKAVEKLKAWKRLRDKGFVFEHYILESGNNKIIFNMSLENKQDLEIAKPDLDLLFGGEE